MADPASSPQREERCPRDSREQSPPGGLAPPPASLPAQAPPPSPAATSDRCHLVMEAAPCCGPAQAPPPSSRPARSWSCLHLDPPDVVDSVVDASVSPPSDSAPSPPPATRPGRPASPPPSQDHRAALPVERWAENVNRYYGAQNAAGGGGGAETGEELSELDSLYQASLQAPSMHRGSRGLSPQLASRPGVRRMLSASGRSKTPTAELERFAFRSSSPQKPPSADDQSYSAENLRRVARSLSGTVIGSRPQTLGPAHSCDSSVSRPALRHSSSSSSLLRRPSTSSLHLSSSSSSSFTDPYHHHHLLQHHHPPRHLLGPSAPAPPPQHLPLQTRSSGLSRGLSGPGGAGQFLAVSDRRAAVPGEGVHGVALSYGTLPRAPRRAPPPCASSTSSLPRPRAGSGPALPPGPQSLYATLSHPRRSAAANGHHFQPPPPGVVNGSSRGAPPLLRAPGDAPPQPLRLDVPPETDWRRDYLTAGSSSARRHHPPLQRTDSRPAAPRPHRDPALCSLCQQLPAEPPRPYCPACRAYVARFGPGS